MARQRGGLNDEQVERLRTERAAGRGPKVLVSLPQFGEEVGGTVVAVGDPAVDGDDFVTVRVKAQGVTDDLRFSPAELSLPGRAARGATRDQPAGRPVGRTAADASTARPASAAPGSEPVAPARPPGTVRGAGVPRAGRSRSPRLTPAAEPSPAPPPAKPPRRTGAPLPKVELTITSSGSSWSVTARRGARTVVKNTPVPPGVVTAVAGLLDHPGVTEAVAAVNEAALREAEERAAALRAELAELEAVLSSHRRP